MTFSHQLDCSNRRTLWEGKVLLLEQDSSCEKVMDFLNFHEKCEKCKNQPKVMIFHETCKKSMTFSHELACSKRRTSRSQRVLLLEQAISCEKVMEFLDFSLKNHHF